jgi:hypothetical protein
MLWLGQRMTSPTISVDDQQIAGSHRLGDVFQSHDGGNAKCLGQDRRVRGATTSVSNQRGNLVTM